LVFSKPVDVEVTKKDQYGRWIGVVQFNGTDANLNQIRLGMAWHYRLYEREQKAGDRLLYSLAENQARNQ